MCWIKLDEKPPEQEQQDAVTPAPAPLSPETIETARKACIGCLGQVLLTLCVCIGAGFALAHAFGWGTGIAVLAALFLTAVFLYCLGKRAEHKPKSSLSVLKRSIGGLRRWPRQYTNRLFDKWGSTEPWWFKAISLLALFPAAVIWLGNNEIGKFWTQRLGLEDLVIWTRHPIYGVVLTIIPILVGALTRKVWQANVSRKNQRLDELDQLHTIFEAHAGKIARSSGPKSVMGGDQEAILAESAVKAMRVLTNENNIRACVLRCKGSVFEKGGYFPENNHPRTPLSTLNDPKSSASLSRRQQSMIVVQDVKVELRKPEPRFLADPERTDIEGSHISYPIQHPKTGNPVAVLTLWSDEPGTFLEGKPADLFRSTLRNLSDAAFVLQERARKPQR